MLMRGTLVEAKFDDRIHGKIDDMARQPDGDTLYRVADHWFAGKYLVAV